MWQSEEHFVGCFMLDTLMIKRVTVEGLVMRLEELDVSVMYPVVDITVTLRVHHQFMLWAHLDFHVPRSWLPLPMLQFQDCSWKEEFLRINMVRAL